MNVARRIGEYGKDRVKQDMAKRGLRTRSLENAVTGEKVKGTAINSMFSKGNLKEEQQISIRLRNEAEINSAKKKGPLGVLLILEACLLKLIAMYENPCDAYGGCAHPESGWFTNQNPRVRFHWVFRKSIEERVNMRENLVKKIDRKSTRMNYSHAA